jgi:ferredoxin
MALRVVIDPGLCMGVGDCIFRAPNVFDWNESQSQARVVQEVVGEDEEEAVRAAVRGCPNFAISIVEEL